MLCLALGLEHRRIKGFARRLAGPNHELKSWEVALADVQRGSQERLALAICRLDPPRQHQSVAIHDEPLLVPKIEVAHPHLLVDERNELLDLEPASLRYLE